MRDDHSRTASAMKRITVDFLFLFFVTGVVFAVSGCGDQLSRAKALEMLKARPQSPPLYTSLNIELSYRLFSISFTDKNLFLMRFPNGAMQPGQWTVVEPKDQHGPFDFAILRRGQYLEAKFADKLVEAGIFKRVAMKNLPPQGFDHASTAVAYELIPAPDVRPGVPFDQGGEGGAEVILGRYELGKVTDIVFNGTTAQVEVQMTFKPTDLGLKLRNYATEFMQEEDTSGREKASTPIAILRKWTDFAHDMPKVYTFTQHDDGWRLD
jgi:hypothetical protein